MTNEEAVALARRIEQEEELPVQASIMYYSRTWFVRLFLKPCERSLKIDQADQWPEIREMWSLCLDND
jgi:hypothetical protein